jgi:uncharacterized protein
MEGDTRTTATPSLFDSDLAIANSCYTGPLLPPDERTRSVGMENLYIIPEGALWATRKDKHAPAEAELAHDAFRGHTLSEMFPCIGAHAALNHVQYRFGMYDELATEASVAGMGRDLRRFAREHEQMGVYTSFISVYRKPVVLSEAEFEALGWKHLQMLHDNDEPVWDPHYSCDPDNPRFAFSLAQRAFFVVGFHVQASRLSRRFTYPAIVFNPESQIRRLKEEGQFETWVEMIRERDISLQGCINPSIPATPETVESEARVYFGKANPPGGWECPFRARPEVVDPHAV